MSEAYCSVVISPCSGDMSEFLMMSCLPFYLPREFTRVYVVAGYVLLLWVSGSHAALLLVDYPSVCCLWSQQLRQFVQLTVWALNRFKPPYFWAEKDLIFFKGHILHAAFVSWQEWKFSLQIKVRFVISTVSSLFTERQFVISVRKRKKTLLETFSTGLCSVSCSYFLCFIPADHITAKLVHKSVFLHHVL